MGSVVRDVGQRFMMGFAGTAPSREVRELVRDFGVGGLFLSEANVEAPEQLVELVRELQSVARQSGAPPLLIATAHLPWTRWPPLSALARAGSDELAQRAGRAIAVELAASGIHACLAPLLTAAPQGRIVVDALQQGGVAAGASAFPGTGGDFEEAPFDRAAQWGVTLLVTEHAVYPELDDRWPATLSGRVIREKLREEHRYDGVVLAGDLGGDALMEWGVEERLALASEAGCDAFLLAGSAVDFQVAAVECMIRATEERRARETFLSPQRDDASLRRMRRLKERFLLPYVDPSPKDARAAATRIEHQALALEIADKGGAST